MRKNKWHEAFKLATGSRAALLLSTILFLSGSSAGVFLELAMNSSEKQLAAQFLRSFLAAGGNSAPNPFEILASGIELNLFLRAMMMLAGLSAIGFPAAHLIVLYKGMAIGFSASLILETSASRGIPALLFSMLPQNLLLIPAFLLAAAASQNYASALLSDRRRGYQKNGRTGTPGFDRYLMIYFILAAAAVLSCFVSAGLFPLLRA